MKKLMIALVAGCMSAAVAGAYAAQGNPADSDKAGRMAPGTAAAQQGATDPNAPSKAGATKGAGATSGSSAGGASTAAGAGGASATTGAGGAAATTGGGMDDTKKGRRAARAAKG
ncbi:MAG TPA: hypothetical protein VED01_11295 [Burkholderiales bacterium]|nr:hypothetical protein [Burkholderiales bacterium]